MRRLLVIVCLSLLFNYAFSQSTRVLRKSETEFPKVSNDFAFIEASTDITQIKFVASFEATGEKNISIYKLYLDILFYAQNYGANAFKVDSFISSDSGKKLVLETFFLTDSILDINFKNHERNVVFIFGNEKINEPREYAFRINGKKKVIYSDEFYKCIIKEGKEIKINNGGLIGSFLNVKWRPEKDAIFCTLTGFETGGFALPAAGGVIMHSGSFKTINNDFGFLLTKVFSQRL